MSKARTSKVTRLYEGREEVKQAKELLALINSTSRDAGYFEKIEGAISALAQANIYLGDFGCTLLTKLLTKHYFREAGKLIQKGADISVAYKDGRTIAHIAAEAGDLKILEFSIENGISVDSATIEGIRIIQYAIANGNTEAVKCLLANNAILTSDDFEGSSAFYSGKVSKIPSYALQMIIKEVSGVKEPLIAASGAELMSDPDGMQEKDDPEAKAKEEALARHIVDGVPMEDFPDSSVVEVVAPRSMEFFPARPYAPSLDAYHDGMCVNASEIQTREYRSMLDNIFESSSMAPLVLPASTVVIEACGFVAPATGRSRASTEESSRTISPSDAFGFASSASEGQLSEHAVSPAEGVSPTGDSAAMDQAE